MLIKIILLLLIILSIISCSVLWFVSLINYQQTIKLELLIKTYMKNYTFMLNSIKHKKPDYIGDWGEKYVLWKDVINMHTNAPLGSKPASLMVVNDKLSSTNTLPEAVSGKLLSLKKFPEQDWFFAYNTYSDFNVQSLKWMNFLQSKLHDFSLYYNQLDMSTGLLYKVIGYNVNSLHFIALGLLLFALLIISLSSKDPYSLIKRNFEARLYVIENFLSLKLNKGRDIIFSNKTAGFYSPNKITYPYYSMMTARFGSHVGNNIVWTIPFPQKAGEAESPSRQFVLSLYLGQKPICKDHDYWKPDYLVVTLDEEEEVRRARKRAYEAEKQKEYEEARRQQGL